jgi:squalene-hopene/tetraprenyl-beta-curcumene cyclase
MTDGGWSTYAGGPSNISASVKAYFGLKLAGFAADHPALERARKKILEMGGVTEVNTFTKIYLCFFGQYDYDAVPAVPPEIVLFPNWFWFNIYEISSWSRAILVPLSICYAKKPFKKIPDEMGVEELFVGGRDKSRMHLHWAKKRISWRNFFLVLDRITHWAERVHIRPLRSLALKKAEKWMLARFEMSDGLGAIYPSMMNSIIALRCLGYSVDDPQVIRALDEFEKLGIEEGDTFRMQPCMSPVWDTAYALFALGEAGVPASDPRLVKCADWILQKQVRKPGDWKIKNPKGEPGGWYFEFNNEFYPDVDDTAMVCLALSRSSIRTGAIRGSRCSGRSIGFCRCSARTEAGPRSTKTTTAWCSSTCPLPITTPCLIPRPSTSRAAFSSALRPMDTTRTIRR